MLVGVLATPLIREMYLEAEDLHCVKIVGIRSFSGPYKHQRDSEHGRFLRSASVQRTLEINEKNVTNFSSLYLSS